MQYSVNSILLKTRNDYANNPRFNKKCFFIISASVIEEPVDVITSEGEEIVYYFDINTNVSYVSPLLDE